MGSKKHDKELMANGRRFIHEKRADAPEGAAGRYRIRKSGVLLMDLAGAPFGFICSNDDYGRAGRGPGFLVTAFEYEGKIRYMHGASRDTEWRLGIPEDARCSHKQEMCASVLRQAAEV